MKMQNISLPEKLKNQTLRPIFTVHLVASL